MEYMLVTLQKGFAILQPHNSNLAHSKFPDALRNCLISRIDFSGRLALDCLEDCHFNLITCRRDMRRILLCDVDNNFESSQ